MKDNRSMFSKMNFLQPSSRRVAVLQRIFSKTYLVTPNEISRSFGVFGTKYAGEKLVKIGDISKVVKPAKNPQYVPLKYVEGESSQEILRHLRWMLQKDLLGQDMFLIGRPGPLRRLLAMQYLEITDRELEYVSLSRDTTEADLKQRREIKNGTAVYFDQSAVRAAVEGRILILEGIEKAERNVLPVLNNLLENREMHLEDGRFLMPAKRYDQLLKEHSQEELDCWKLVRVSENFRVIALGIPVPRYVGNPLDPPLRSRFQARDISGLTYKEQLEALRALVPGLEGARLSQLLSCAHALLTADAAALGLADFPADGLPAAARILENTPSLPDYDALYRLYPYKSFLSAEGQAAVENVLSTFQVLPRRSKSVSMNINNVTPKNGTAEVEITVERKSSVLQVPCGSLRENVVTNDFVPNVYQEKLLADLMLSHQFKDICVIGPRGCGKSATVSEFAKRLNYVVEPIVLYQDMTSRDLLQQRSTLLNGDTVWQNSPLVTAALEGKLAVLDGIHRIHPSTLAVVHRLVHDRELTLHDGSRLLRHDRYDDIKSSQNLTDNQLEEYGIFKIHPSFRIIALAEPPVQGSSLTQWLSPEMLSLFLYHEMRPLKPDEEMHLVKNLLGSANKAFEHVMRVAHRMRESDDPAVRALSSSLSTRQLLRIAKRMRAYPGDSPANAIYRACLARFLPALPRQALDKILLDEDLPLINAETSSPTCKVEGEKVTIGNTTVPRYKTDAKTKIPDIQFYDVPQHVTALEWLLQDFFLGEHLLLIGNQGVGKNKLADRLLQLLNRPREYIQLHRDTTVQTLTLQPTVRDGVVVYEDSPLVQAVKLGHVLIVDEADKAPTHVTCILKTLVESGEMILSDGRRIVPLNHPQTPTNKGIIPIHPDFRMIVLANRPGFPFLGNDFFGALGDLFSCHAVDNPSAQSEHALLKQYGPDVPDEIIARLVRAFGELRNMADQGLVQYPYSTREVVNIVKHLQEFPNESLVNVVGNVFDFDTYSQEVQDTLTEVLQKNGIPLHVHTNKINLAKEFPLPPLQQAGEWKVTHPSPPTILPVEERFLRTKTPITLRKYQHPLDLTEARGSVFSEMQSYWVVPVGETGIVAGLAVSKSFENDPLKDWIHVMATNPMKLFSMQSSGKDIHELSLQGLLHPVRGSRPRFKMCPIKTDDSSILLIHEESSNGLVLVDPFAGYARPLAQTSFIEDTTATLASAFPFNVKDKNWKMLTDLVEDKKFIVLFEDNGQRIDAINVETMTAYSMTLPVNLKTLNLPSIDRWLVEDTESRKYLLAKADPSEPIPRVLQPIEERTDTTLLKSIFGCGNTQLPSPVLSQAVNQKIEAPNRIFSSRLSSAVIAVGFPDLELSGNQLYLWPRVKDMSSTDSMEKTIVLPDSGTIIRPINTTSLPEKILEEDREIHHTVAGYLEITDIINRKLRYIAVPQPLNVSPVTAWMYSNNQLPVFVTGTSRDGLATVDAGGCVRLWEVEIGNLTKSLQEWRRMVASDRDHLQLTIDKPSGKDVSAPKHGKVDEKGDPHVGGNTWAGGTGGRDTAGLGGKGGPYRLDAGHDVHQVSQAEKDAVPEHVKKAAHEMAQKAFKQRLREIQMSEYDASVYQQYLGSVAAQVQALRVILGSLQAKSKERQWQRHQTTGELDDAKLIEGLTGEKTIYRRRFEKEPELGTPQTKPKRLKFIVDVSGSMYRFNGYDGRLDREMEAVIMVMEAFQGFEAQIQYDIMGHSGEDYNLQFVDHRKPPVDNKQRLDIIKIMHAHSQFCLSGDHTLEATKFGISQLSKEDCDEAIVVVLSDANLRRYGIAPESFAKILTSESNVSAYAIFIGSLGDEAVRLTKQMPAGRAFVCLDLTKLPQILQQIFSASVLSTR
ncbi:hypothetical protein R5R35_008422 [Gryllus longicercus]|uniref:von Willebrand factor A domain-containing protein 8 n=1 Tax=Gryllus longicercus TaxID=2509291 RepID=A0AAN9VR03_9ORTH